MVDRPRYRCHSCTRHETDLTYTNLLHPNSWEGGLARGGHRDSWSSLNLESQGMDCRSPGRRNWCGRPRVDSDTVSWHSHRRSTSLCHKSEPHCHLPRCDIPEEREPCQVRGRHGSDSRRQYHRSALLCRSHFGSGNTVGESSRHSCRLEFRKMCSRPSASYRRSKLC